MAAFKQDFTIEQSSDCTTLTFADISNMDDNDEGYDYDYFTTKNFGVYDSNNMLIGDLIDITDSTPVTFDLDKDRYLTIIETLQHNSDTPLTKTYDVALSCNVDLALGDAIVENILNENATNEVDLDDETMFNIIKAVKAAQIFGSRSNGTLSQDMLDLANSYIDTTNKCFN